MIKTSLRSFEPIQQAFLWDCLGKLSHKVKSESEIAQSYLTLCDPVDCSLPGSSVHGILQARVLEWVAISFCRKPSRPRDWTRVSCIAGRWFTLWATREAPNCPIGEQYSNKAFTISEPKPQQCCFLNPSY